MGGADRDAMCYRYAQALCNAAGGDGIMTQGERDWIQGYMAVKNMGPKVQSELEALCAKPKDLEQVAQDTVDAMSVGTLKFAGRAIVFDSIRAAAADGVAPEEKKA